jgi:hypothetical protein
MSNFKSMKGSSDGEIWNPTSRKITGKDGKEYNSRMPNPKEGEEPSRTGFYLGYETFPSKREGQKDIVLHKFQSETDGKIWKVFGTFDIDNQLREAVREHGLGRLTMVKWNGYVVKAKSKDKPDDILKLGSPDDHYHDWEVLVDTDTPAIKVAGSEVYKSQSNVAPTPAPATTQAPSPVAEMPAKLEFENGNDDDLPAY